MTRLLIATGSPQVRDQVAATCAELEGVQIVGYAATVDQLRPLLELDEEIDLVLLDEHFAGSGYDVVRDLSLANPLLGIIVLIGRSSPAALESALRSGARAVLAVPPSLEEFRQRLDSVSAWTQSARRQLSASRQGPERSGRVVGLTGAKGGVGTSLIALLLARDSVTAGTVCVVDLDVRNGDLASYAGVAVRRTITDLVEISDELTGRALGETMYQLAHGIRLLPAPNEAEDGELLTVDVVRQIIGALRLQYDTVVLDVGSRLDDVTAMALEASDLVVVVATPDAPAFRAGRRLIETLERLEVVPRAKCRLLVNRASRSSDVQPALGPKVVGLPLIGSIPSIGSTLETAMNTATVLEPRFAEAETALAAIRDTAGIGRDIPPTPTAGADRPTRRGARRAAASATTAKAPATAEAGQVLVETPMLVVTAFIVVLLCIQMVLWGVSHLIAVDAAQEAAHSYGVGSSTNQVRADLSDHLPSGWSHDWRLTRSGDLVTVSIRTPSIVPNLVPRSSAEAVVSWED